MTPWRTGMPERPLVPLPPAPMPMLRGGRPLKRWRYLGCYGPDVMLCAAVARVGPLPLAWYAVWDREQRTLVDHTLRRPRGVTVEPGRVQLADGPVTLDLEVDRKSGA